jgi:hypothetical protein
MQRFLKVLQKTGPSDLVQIQQLDQRRTNQVR